MLALDDVQASRTQDAVLSLGLAEAEREPLAWPTRSEFVLNDRPKQSSTTSA
jgi:hypothetical protein